MWKFLDFVRRIYNGPTHPAYDQDNNVLRQNMSGVWYEASVKVQRGEYRWCLHFLPLNRRTIGRDYENDLTVNDERVSLLHAIATFDGNRLVIGDTLSALGTFVNGRRLNRGESVEVRANDVIHLGPVRVMIRRIREHRVTPDPTGSTALAGGGQIRRCA